MKLINNKKMKRSLYLLACLFVLISSCKNDDDVPSRTIFTFTGRNAGGVHEDWWILLHDNESGDLIDAKQVFEKQTTTFESKKKISGNKMTVTFFRGSNTSLGSNVADIHRDIDVGAEWSYGFRDNVTQTNIEYGGEYSLSVTDVPTLYSSTVTDGYGEIEFTNGFKYADNILSATPFTSNSTKTPMVVIETTEDHPKYYMLNGDIIADEEFNISYNDFKDFDKYLTVDLPEGEILDQSYISGDYDQSLAVYYGYILQDFNWQQGIPIKSTINVPLLNSISKYYIYLRTNTWIYTSQGNPPSSIEFVSSDGYTSTGQSFDDFKVTTTKDYVYSQSYFGYSSGNTHTDLTYYAAKGSEKPFYTLTSDLEQKYLVDKSKITYNGTFFNVKGRTHADVVRWMFDNDFDLNSTYEESIVGGEHVQ